MSITLSISQIIGILVGLVVIAGVLIKIGIWVGSVNSDRKTFKEFMKDIKTEIKEINNKIFRIGSHLGIDVIDSNSPLKLSKLGKKIRADLDASEWIDRFADAKKAELEGCDAYEIQELCFEYAKRDDIYSDKEQKRIRAVAFSNGLDESDVQRVIGIELRDKLLKMVGKD